MENSIPVTAQVAATIAAAVLGVFLVGGVLKAIFAILGAALTGLLWASPFFLVALGITAFSLPLQ